MAAFGHHGRMSKIERTRKPSSKGRRKKRRVKLGMASNGRAPTLVCAQADGVEGTALDLARQAGLAHAGFVPSGTRNPGETFLATPTRHPSQALKWNVHASDVSVLVTPDAVLFGRALLAQQWCERYRKPWLHVHAGCCDPEYIRIWLRTRAPKSIHVTGARAHQAERLREVVAVLMGVIAEAKAQTGSS
jgi:hypothetical protein